jgi:hypothetical protein
MEVFLYQCHADQNSFSHAAMEPNAQDGLIVPAVHKWQD